MLNHGENIYTVHVSFKLITEYRIGLSQKKTQKKTAVVKVHYSSCVICSAEYCSRMMEGISSCGSLTTLIVVLILVSFPVRSWSKEETYKPLRDVSGILISRTYLPNCRSRRFIHILKIEEKKNLWFASRQVKMQSWRDFIPLILKPLLV